MMMMMMIFMNLDWLSKPNCKIFYLLRWAKVLQLYKLDRLIANFGNVFVKSFSTYFVQCFSRFNVFLCST